jgi:hypothetical protein
MMLCKIPGLPELFHGNEEMSVEVDVCGCGAGKRVQEGTAGRLNFLHLKCHLEVTCVLQAQVPNSSPAIKNGWQTGQSAVKN